MDGARAEPHRGLSGVGGRERSDRVGDRCGRVAYLMSRFPKLTETFVLYEMLEVEAAGHPIEVYPLRRERGSVSHPEADGVCARAHFAPLLSARILAAHLHFLRRCPGAYLSALGTLLSRNLGSRRYLLGALAFFPKSVYFARDMEARGVAHVTAEKQDRPYLRQSYLWTIVVFYCQAKA